MSVNRDTVRWCHVTEVRALRAGTSGTRVQQQLGLRIEKRECRVVRDVTDFWLDQRIGEWTAAFRIVAVKGRPAIGEVRIFPAHDVVDAADGSVPQWPSGEWVSGTLAGVRAAIPTGGVTAKILQDVKPHLMRRLAEHIVRLLYRNQRGRVPPPVLQYFSPYAPPRVRSTRGRKSLSHAFYAQIARDYDDARRTGRPPAQCLMQQHHAPESRVRGWIHRARRLGFLEGPVLHGKASGTFSSNGGKKRR
jgi:hypothetical protein